MDMTTPLRSVSPTLQGEVLAVLAKTTLPMTGREVARGVARGSHAGVNRALHRLAEHGIVLRAASGSSNQWVLNRRHLAFEAIQALAFMRNVMIERLRTTIADWPVAAVHASLFGSAARGDGGPGSDVDLLLVRADGVSDDDEQWVSQTMAMVSDVLHCTGNHAAVIEVGTAEVREWIRKPNALFDQIRQDGIRLAGPPFPEFVRSSAA